MLLKKLVDRRQAALAVIAEASITPALELPEISEFPIFVPADALAAIQERKEDLTTIR